MKIAIIFNHASLSGKLTKIFTGCYAYHIGFVDDAHNKFYDMNLIFRRRNWPYYPPTHVKLYDCPVEITREDLEHWLDTDDDYYSIKDYFMFSVRKFFKILGFNTRNYKGAICSEKVNQILIWKGWDSPWPLSDAPPSPCDFVKVLNENRNNPKTT